ncbi:hypothetical protein [Corynebacterium glucuronolyticum]|uniref:hypothetical protein n=1 Tax=Corynebacterium glucuronolyticum TaxID=39791 RepID=UPI00223A76AF|nr:hypothetical protein [Corynebacterium glucuronolyticum]MCT1443280.1 hypothetical protein [Corynebacterium glucuronolyticum]
MKKKDDFSVVPDEIFPIEDDPFPNLTSSEIEIDGREFYNDPGEKFLFSAEPFTKFTFPRKVTASQVLSYSDGETDYKVMAVENFPYGRNARLALFWLVREALRRQRYFGVTSTLKEHDPDAYLTALNNARRIPIPDCSNNYLLRNIVTPGHPEDSAEAISASNLRNSVIEQLRAIFNLAIYPDPKSGAGVNFHMGETWDIPVSRQSTDAKIYNYDQGSGLFQMPDKTFIKLTTNAFPLDQEMISHLMEDTIAIDLYTMLVNEMGNNCNQKAKITLDYKRLTQVLFPDFDDPEDSVPSPSEMKERIINAFSLIAERAPALMMVLQPDRLEFSGSLPPTQSVVDIFENH